MSGLVSLIQHLKWHKSRFVLLCQIFDIRLCCFNCGLSEKSEQTKLIYPPQRCIAACQCDCCACQICQRCLDHNLRGLRQSWLMFHNALIWNAKRIPTMLQPTRIFPTSPTSARSKHLFGILLELPLWRCQPLLTPLASIQRRARPRGCPASSRWQPAPYLIAATLIIFASNRIVQPLANFTLTVISIIYLEYF